MNKHLLQQLILFIIGISEGIVVGSSIAAFITLLDIVPRLAQLTNSTSKINIYEKTLIISVVIVTLVTFFKIKLNMSKYLLIPIGLVMGIFIGLLAAALAEVVNVIPVLSRRLNIKEYVYIVLIALSLGKVIGSLIQWLILV